MRISGKFGGNFDDPSLNASLMSLYTTAGVTFVLNMNGNLHTAPGYPANESCHLTLLTERRQSVAHTSSLRV